LVVVGVVAGIFYLQVFMNSPAMVDMFTVAGFNTANIITSILSAIVIAVSSYQLAAISRHFSSYFFALPSHDNI
jgi:hypothetical protein